MPSFIIVGYVWKILGMGGLFAPSLIREQPRKSPSWIGLKLLFFTINLHFVKSNQISTYRKLNLPLTSSIYFVVLSVEMQKRLQQTKVCYSFSYFVWKETTHKPLKVEAAKTLFSSVCVIGTTCFDECFFILCDNWKTSVFVKFYRCSETFEAPCCCFLWRWCFEWCPYFMRYLHNNNMMLIPKFQSKAD